jgi:hypothetical protein
LLVLCTGGEVFAVRTEADTPDIQVSVFVDGFILKGRDVQASGHIKDLGGSIATGSHVFSVPAKSHAADNTVMHQMVDELYVQDSLDFRIEDGVPVRGFPLLSRG